MRNLSLIILFTGFGLNANLLFGQENQVHKPNLFLSLSSQLSLSNANQGGSLGFGSVHLQDSKDPTNTEEESRYWGVNLAPKLGYFIAPIVVGGLDLQYAYFSSSNNTAESEYTSQLYLISPFIRICLSKDYREIYPFLEFSSGLGRQAIEVSFKDQPTTISETSLFQFSGLFGISIPLCNQSFLDLGLRYQSLSSKQIDDNPENLELINNQIALTIGFQITL